jgi:hypothetical protein
MVASFFVKAAGGGAGTAMLSGIALPPHFIIETRM